MKRPQVSKYGGMSCEEVGAAMGISPEAVRVIENDALAKIRKILGDPTQWPCLQLRVPALLKRRLQLADIASEAPIEDDYRLRAAEDVEVRI